MRSTITPHHSVCRLSLVNRVHVIVVMLITEGTDNYNSVAERLLTT